MVEGEYLRVQLAQLRQQRGRHRLHLRIFILTPLLDEVEDLREGLQVVQLHHCVGGYYLHQEGRGARSRELHQLYYQLAAHRRVLHPPQAALILQLLNVLTHEHLRKLLHVRRGRYLVEHQLHESVRRIHRPERKIRSLQLQADLLIRFPLHPNKQLVKSSSLHLQEKWSDEQ